MPFRESVRVAFEVRVVEDYALVRGRELVESYPAAHAPGEFDDAAVRSRDDRWLSGVCGGVAEYAGIDANLVRLVVVLGTIFGFGSLLLAYIVAWVLMPQA